MGSWKPDSPGSTAQNIMVSFNNRWQRDDFGDACGALGDVCVHPTKIVQGIVYPFCKGDAAFGLG